jgi:hypothetical protein
MLLIFFIGAYCEGAAFTCLEGRGLPADKVFEVVD